MIRNLMNLNIMIEQFGFVASTPNIQLYHSLTMLLTWHKSEKKASKTDLILIYIFYDYFSLMNWIWTIH